MWRDRAFYWLLPECVWVLEFCISVAAPDVSLTLCFVFKGPPAWLFSVCGFWSKNSSLEPALAPRFTWQQHISSNVATCKKWKETEKGRWGHLYDLEKCGKIFIQYCLRATAWTNNERSVKILNNVTQRSRDELNIQFYKWQRVIEWCFHRLYTHHINNSNSEYFRDTGAGMMDL